MIRHRQPEVALQRSVFQHFRARGAPGVFAFHVQEQALAALREAGAEVAVAYGLDAARGGVMNVIADCTTISEPTAQDQDALGTGWMDILLTAFNRMIAEGIIEPADDEEPAPWGANMRSWRRAAAEYHRDCAGRTAIVETRRENVTRAAATATIDALVFSLRRGVGELANADSRRRLSEFSEEQLRAVCDRLRNFKSDIATPWVPEEVEAFTIIWSELKNG